MRNYVALTGSPGQADWLDVREVPTENGVQMESFVPV